MEHVVNKYLFKKKADVPIGRNLHCHSPYWHDDAEKDVQ
jgi:hypothetical protein